MYAFNVFSNAKTIIISSISVYENETSKNIADNSA